MKHAGGFLGMVEDALTRVREISAVEVAALQKSGAPFALIDVREDGEWAAGHAAGAAHIGKGVIERDIEANIPAKDTKIVLYCGGGYRSALAGDALQKMGYTNVFSMAGGWRAWCEAGFPRA